MLKIILIFGTLLVTTTSTFTDEQYAFMPDIFHLDDFDNCMLLKEKSLYCSVAFELAPRDESNIPEVWKTIKEVSSSHLRYRHDLIRDGICVAKTCPNVNTYDASDSNFLQQIEDCFNNKFKSYELKGTVKTVECRTAAPLYKIDVLDYIVAIVIGSYILMVAMTSTYDFYRRYDNEQDYKKFRDTSVGKLTTIFSIPSNWNKLKSIPTGNDFEKLKSVQGIRVYMTFVVIMVHGCIAVSAIPVSNPQWLEKLNENPNLLSEFPKRGVYLLSFHFMMSTWMLINSLLAKSDKNEDIDAKFLIKSTIKRYVRFMPLFAVIVVFFATWFRHIPFGPYGFGTCDESQKCRENWWTNILLIQTFVNRYRMCHIISWYLAVEMHYYIFSMMIIKVLVKYRSKIKCILATLLMFCILVTFLDHYRHGYSSRLQANPEDVYRLKFNTKPQWHDHFTNYFGNFSGSILGLWFGYVYYKYKNQQLFKSKISKALWWFFSFGLVNIVLLLPMYVDVDKTPVHSALWVAVTRPLFATGMGLLALGLSQGLGGIVKWTFEWTPLQILAKLSFCVYISHSVLQSIRVGMMRHLSFLDYYEFTNIVLSDIFISFLATVPLTLLFEMPANEIANRLFKAEKPKEKRT